MKKLTAEFMNFASHNTGFVAAQTLIIVTLIWVQGCPSTTRSILDPSVKVTRGELQIEIDTLLATADLRYADLDKQDQIKKMITDHALLWSTTGAINPVGLITALVGIAGIGATVDNVTKRRKERKALNAYYNDTRKTNG